MVSALRRVASVAISLKQRVLKRVAAEARGNSAMECSQGRVRVGGRPNSADHGDPIGASRTSVFRALRPINATNCDELGGGPRLVRSRVRR